MHARMQLQAQARMPAAGALGRQHGKRPCKDHAAGHTVACAFQPSYSPPPPLPHLPHLQVIDGTMVKIYAWYDNEYGYSARMVDIARMVATKLQASA